MAIDYELAKELRDAGFKFFPIRKEDVQLFGEAWIEKSTDYYRFPTLSELIEACGDGYFDLYTGSGSPWTAMFATDGLASGKGKGDTPEEAVARLWLALNKHD